MDFVHQSIIIHFTNGSIERAVLQSSPLEGRAIYYISRPLSDGRRTVPRVPFISEVKIDQQTTRRTVDISAGGIYVESLTSYPIGTILPLSFEICNEMLDLTARVAFNDPGIGMGLEFHNLGLSSRLKINTFLQKALKTPNPRSPQDRRLKDRTLPALKAGPSGKNPAEIQGDGRKQDRSAKEACAEAKLEEVKLLFFLESERKRISVHNCLFSGQEASVEFTDGESIRGILPEDSSAAMGFVFNAYISDQSTYTLFVVKTAVRSIQYT